MKKIIFGIVGLTLLIVVSILLLRGSKMQEEQNIDMTYLIPGRVVVGFKKGVDQASAEYLLKRFKLSFIKTDSVNMGRDFALDTGEKFIVKVPEGKEMKWIKSRPRDSRKKQSTNCLPLLWIHLPGM